jgi:hypothetical protein
LKLNDRKVGWLILEKLKGRGSGELALIQKVTRRRVEQLWQAYWLTGLMPTLKQLGRLRRNRDPKEAMRLVEHLTPSKNAIPSQSLVYPRSDKNFIFFYDREAHCLSPRLKSGDSYFYIDPLGIPLLRFHLHPSQRRSIGEDTTALRPLGAWL